MEENSNAAAAGRTVPFEIDLNEIPDDIVYLGETRNDEGSGGGGAAAVENVVLVCSVCGVKHQGRERRNDWKCLKCLMAIAEANSRGGSAGAIGGSGGGGGAGGGGGRGVVLDLDMNAMPPEAEGEGEVFVDVRNHLTVATAPAAAATQRNVDSNRGRSNVQGEYFTYFTGHPFNARSTHSNLWQMENSFNLQKASQNVDIGKSGGENAIERISYSDRKKIGPVLTCQEKLSASHSTVLSNRPPTPNELYLEALREHIVEWGGVLGDGWHVEFVFCPKRIKTFAVYLAPDGSKFESVPDVASHLGLRSSCHTREAKNGDNGSTIVQKASDMSRKRKEATGSSRSSGHVQSQNIWMGSSGMGLSAGSGIISDHELIESRLVDNANCESHHVHDGFPIQFEDFFLISAGNIDVRPSYHGTSQIWPVGYKSNWHDKITGSLFVCEVADGGDSGPLFKVKRYPCSTQSIPIGATILRPKLSSSGVENKIEEEGLAASAVFGSVDDETSAIEMMLTECSPPHMGNDISLSKRGNEDYRSQGPNICTSETDYPSERCRSASFDISEHMDVIGEFLVEGRSASLVWEMASQKLLWALGEAYKQKGAVQFCCNDDVHGMSSNEIRSLDSLSKFSCLAGPDNIPDLVHDDDSVKTTTEMLMKWLGQDRFGLDTEFVQEIIEQLPGINSCTAYKPLTERNLNSALHTVGSGFLLAKRKSTIRVSENLFGSSKRARKQSEELETRAPFPAGKPLSSLLPAYLIGDAFQAWEFSWRFSEILGLEEPFSFQELEFELLNPWLDSLHPLVKPWRGIPDVEGITFGRIKGNIPRARMVCQTHSRYTGLFLAQMHSSLLKMLAGELLSRVVVYVDPNFDAGESKSRRGRKRDSDVSATAKKIMLDMLPINEFTWPEVARRYILAVLTMGCNLDSSEVACRESGKVFQCLRGDGGTLCGSLTGVAALEADAMLLAEATKKIFGSLKTKSDLVSVEREQSDASGSSKMIETKTGNIPEWAQVLEPVRKLPTNVGARIRKCINEALEKNPPEWARRRLEHSISKEVYKGNASGPTKRAVISVLTELGGKKDVQQQSEKKEKVKIVNTVSDLIMKQCRIVLRRVAAADEDRVFCNLLGRTHLNPSDNDDEGLLGYPAMVSRPLDFRSIDLRLAAGAYGGSHEAFFEDVQEVWHSIRIAYRDHPDLIELAERLFQRFEELYNKEVTTVAQKIAEYANVTSNIEVEKQKDDLLAYVSDSSLPKAPWEEGICKVCGMDKDDDNVLLCDGCDSEYHTYCLNPPLVRIPEGNWYCPSCVARQSMSRAAAYGCQFVNQCKRKKYRGEYTHKYLETLSQLANTMVMREYWELTADERVFLMKFLCDEALNLVVFRDHMDQCASLSTDLQQKLRSLTSEWKIQKLREEILSANSVKDNILHTENRELGVGILASVPANDNKSMGNLLDRSSHINHTSVENVIPDSHLGVKGVSGHDKLPVSSHQQKTDQLQDVVSNTFDSRPDNGHGSSPVHSAGLVIPNNLSCAIGNHMVENGTSMPVDSTDKFHGNKSKDEDEMNSSKSHDLESGSQKQDTSALLDSIATLESEIVKVSLRREFLGRDAHGRLYWVYSRPGSRPGILVNSVVSGDVSSGNLLPYDTEKFSAPGVFSVQKWYASEQSYGIPGCGLWMCFHSDSEIAELIGWLQDSDEREKELKESILQWQKNKAKIFNCSMNDLQSERDIITSNHKTDSDSEFPVTAALTKLKKKFGPCLEPMAVDIQSQVLEVKEGTVYRCQCLEPLWLSRHHCLSCHQTFFTSQEQAQHSNQNCKMQLPLPWSSQNTERSSKCRKTMKNNETLLEKCFVDLNDKHDTGSNLAQNHHELECPFNFEEIKAKFIIPSSLKELVKEIGFLGSKGIPSFAPGESPYLTDPALVPGKINGVTPEGISESFESRQGSNNAATSMANLKHKSISNNLTSNAESRINMGPSAERIKLRSALEGNQASTAKDRSSLFFVNRSSLIHEFALRPLVGRVSKILRCLKINLLDMDAALPEEALRVSRSYPDRRRAWRLFTKSANTIYEMVQATTTLEDMIKGEYLRNDWWYWSSPSAAAKASTVSALALRIYALDSAILYEKSASSDDATEALKPLCVLDQEAPQSSTTSKPGSPSMQRTPDSDLPENTRPRTRVSKRRRDSGG